jgi:hypothetical protein
MIGFNSTCGVKVEGAILQAKKIWLLPKLYRELLQGGVFWPFRQPFIFGAVDCVSHIQN